MDERGEVKSFAWNWWWKRGGGGGTKETWSTGLVDSLITNSILGRVFIPFSHYVSIKRVACLAPSSRRANSEIRFSLEAFVPVVLVVGIWDRVEDDAFFTTSLIFVINPSTDLLFLFSFFKRIIYFAIK